MAYSFLPFFFKTDNSTSFKLNPLRRFDLMKASLEVIGTSVGKFGYRVARDSAN